MQNTKNVLILENMQNKKSINNMKGIDIEHKTMDNIYQISDIVQCLTSLIELIKEDQQIKFQIIKYENESKSLGDYGLHSFSGLTDEQYKYIFNKEEKTSIVKKDTKIAE